jgi:hypothetical protein
MNENRIECNKLQVQLESELVVTREIYYVEDFEEWGWNFVGSHVRERPEPTKIHCGKLNEWYGY